MKNLNVNAEQTKKILDAVDFLMWYLLVVPFVFLPICVATIVCAVVDEIIRSICLNNCSDDKDIENKQ